MHWELDLDGCPVGHRQVDIPVRIIVDLVRHMSRRDRLEGVVLHQRFGPYRDGDAVGGIIDDQRIDLLSVLFLFYAVGQLVFRVEETGEDVDAFLDDPGEGLVATFQAEFRVVGPVDGDLSGSGDGDHDAVRTEVEVVAVHVGVVLDVPGIRGQVDIDGCGPDVLHDHTGFMAGDVDLGDPAGQSEIGGSRVLSEVDDCLSGQDDLSLHVDLGEVGIHRNGHAVSFGHDQGGAFGVDDVL